MIFNILHLNIERNRHTDAVKKLLKDKKPDIVCFAEAMHKDVESFASVVGYNLAFAPRLVLEDGALDDQEGVAILSKYSILNIKKHRYDDNVLGNPPVYKIENLGMKNGERPKARFQDNYTFLTALIQLNDKQTLTISTTHFPVTDHTTPGLEDHEITNFQNVDDIERSEIYLERLINLIHSVNGPIVFTADLNNPRGEYFYDALAHQLVDRVPSTLESSIDPKLHRVKNLKLMVDTIMTSSDVGVKSFEVIEGVSDHKAFLVALEV